MDDYLCTPTTAPLTAFVAKNPSMRRNVLPVQLPARGQRRCPEVCRRVQGSVAVADERADAAVHGDDRREARRPRLPRQGDRDVPQYRGNGASRRLRGDRRRRIPSRPPGLREACQGKGRGERPALLGKE